MINFKTDKKGHYEPLKPSRYQEDQSRVQIRNDTVQSINSRLNSNHAKIIDLLKERRDLLAKKIEAMQKDNQHKLESIARARTQDLKNQARLLKDQSIVNLVENADRLNSTKALLHRIANQDIASFQNIENTKGKKYWDRFKETQPQIQSRNKRYLIVLGELQKVGQRERLIFQQIQKFEGQIISVLKRKQKDYIRRAELLNQQIQKRKMALKQNKIIKDRKKSQLTEVLSSLLDTIKYHEDATMTRHRELDELFSGSDGLQSFDQFFANFEIVVQHKVQENKPPQAGFRKLSQLMAGYQQLIQEVGKMRQDEGLIFQQVGSILRKNIKIGVLEKAYLAGLSTNKNQLLQLVKKCKMYRRLLGSIEQDRTKIGKEILRVTQLNTFFYNQYKSISNESTRKQQLRQQLQRILQEQNQLQKNQKKKRNYQYQIGNLQLKRKAIQREMQDCASKGNVNEYKSKVRELEKVDSQIEKQKQIGNNNNSSYMESKLLSDVQLLNEKYSDIIKDVIIEEQQMSYFIFLNKLSKRLSLI